MKIALNKLKANRDAKKSAKRVGRGNASGKGTYSARGLKGQRSRSGGKKGLKAKGFRQNLLNFPKFKGMKSSRATNEVSLATLNKAFNDGDQVTPQALKEKNIIATIKAGVKIIATGELTKKLEVADCKVSAGAQQIIEKNGGKVSPVVVLEKKDKKETAKK